MRENLRRVQTGLPIAPRAVDALRRRFGRWAPRGPSGPEAPAGIRMAQFVFQPERYPSRPGCYLMKSARGRVIYVGKAKDLRRRLATYFRPMYAADARCGWRPTSATSRSSSSTTSWKPWSWSTT